MTSAPSTRQNLDVVLPKISAAADKILKEFGWTILAAEKSKRVHYFTINGTRRENVQTISKVVIEHVFFFFEKLWPHFHEAFGETFEAELMVLVAYKETQKWWITGKQASMAQHNLSRAHFPTIMIIDVAQGHQATMTITDCAVQEVDGKSDVGFTADYGRFNVSVTRGKAVGWIIGGNCDAKYISSGVGKGASTTPIPVQYYNACVANDQHTDTGYGPIPDEKLPRALTQSDDQTYAHFFTAGEQATATGGDDTNAEEQDGAVNGEEEAPLSIMQQLRRLLNKPDSGDGQDGAKNQTTDDQVTVASGGQGFITASTGTGGLVPAPGGDAVEPNW